MPSPSVILHRLQVVSRLLLRRLYTIMVWLYSVVSIHIVFHLIELTLEPSILNGWPHFKDLLLLELVELVDFLSCNVLVMLTVYISFIIEWVPHTLCHLGDDYLALFDHFVNVFMLELLSGYLCGATDLILRCVALNNWIVPDVAQEVFLADIKQTIVSLAHYWVPLIAIHQWLRMHASNSIPLLQERHKRILKLLFVSYIWFIEHS